jgi:peptidoglycan/xylan/chitin deacetylase (PgdA/CDA1 family)
MNQLIIIIILLILILPIVAAFKIGWGVYVRSKCKLDTKERIVAITFDDGPDDRNLPKLLDVLDKKGVKSTFFFIGEAIAKKPDKLIQTLDEGHNVGIHTYSHSPFFPFYSLNKIVYEIQETRMLIKSISKIETSLFRPPFGVTNPNIAYVIHRLKLTSVGWNIRSFDTISRSKEKIVRRIMRRLKPGSIILLHSNLDGAAELAGLVIDSIRDRGYTIVNL